MIHLAPETTASHPSLDIDLYRPEVWENPWPILAQIREAGPLVWNEQGYWMTARDRVCRQIMANPGHLGMQGVVSTLFGPDAFIAIDDKPAHNRLRNVWAAAFSKAGVEQLVALVRTLADGMLKSVDEELRSGATVDLMQALCRPLPAYVIASMLGVADEMIAMVIRWSDLMADATSGGFPIDYDHDPAWLASEGAKQELGEFIIDQIAYRRKAPGEDLISRIVQSEVGRSMSDDAMMNNARQLIFAGNETTAKWLGHVLVTLGQGGRTRAEVVADPSLLPAAIEEVMRWQGVTHATPRNVASPGVMAGDVELPIGAEVVLLLGAAGRDPARYDDPDKFDIHRPGKPHLGFGFGMHSCVGAVLARMEVTQVTSAMLDRYPVFSVTDRVEYSGFSLRGPLSVPAKLLCS